MAIFFLEIFLFKELPKKHVPSFLLPWWKKIPSLLFIRFSWLLFTLTLLGNLFLRTKLKYFDFFNPIPGGGVIFTSPIHLGKYLTNSAQSWPEGKSWLRNWFSTFKNLKKSMTSWIILLPSAKNSSFSDFYCISMAVTNIILYVVWHLEHGGIISFFI